jgi:hypothetical protein
MSMIQTIHHGGHGEHGESLIESALFLSVFSVSSVVIIFGFSLSGLT